MEVLSEFIDVRYSKKSGNVRNSRSSKISRVEKNRLKNLKIKELMEENNRMYKLGLKKGITDEMRNRYAGIVNELKQLKGILRR